MFALSATDLCGRILGCGDGPASFNAEMQMRGHQVISVDPIYQFSACQIRQQVEATYEVIISQVQAQPQAYIWKTFQSPEDLGRSRLATMEKFLADYDSTDAATRYREAALPNLPFDDGQFDLALCSHFLFLYAEQLSLEFHQAAIQELYRVAHEVRIFPLITLNGQPSLVLDPVLKTLAEDGLQTEIVTVDYEFQRGGNQMLRIVNTT